jgi:hypothetical protein
MLESMVGDKINFNSADNTMNITVQGKKISNFQTNNTAAYFPLGLKDESELTDTRLGNLVSTCINMPAEDWRGWADRLKDEGMTRTYFTLNATDIAAGDSANANLELEIPSEYIDLYQYMKDIGIKTHVCLMFWDTAYRMNGGAISKDRLSSEAELERYLEYVEMVVTSLKGGCTVMSCGMSRMQIMIFISGLMPKIISLWQDARYRSSKA